MAKGETTGQSVINYFNRSRHICPGDTKSNKSANIQTCSLKHRGLIGKALSRFERFNSYTSQRFQHLAW